MIKILSRVSARARARTPIPAPEGAAPAKDATSPGATRRPQRRSIALKTRQGVAGKLDTLVSQKAKFTLLLDATPPGDPSGHARVPTSDFKTPPRTPPAPRNTLPSPIIGPNILAPEKNANSNPTSHPGTPTAHFHEPNYTKAYFPEPEDLRPTPPVPTRHKHYFLNNQTAKRL